MSSKTLKLDICIKLAKWAFWINVLFFIIYNSIFGWNADAMSKAEKICDMIYQVVFFTSIVVYLIPLLVIYETAVEKFDESPDVHIIRLSVGISESEQNDEMDKH